MLACKKSIPTLISNLRNEEPEAAEEIWKRYFPQLVRLARNRLKGVKYASADEEDIATTAFTSFCTGLRDGRYPDVCNHKTLWSLLVSITAHKCVDLVRRENRLKRGGVIGNDPADDRSTSRELFDDIAEHNSTPVSSALVNEQLEALVVKLNEGDDPDLLVIAVTTMLGDSASEVAAQLGCVRRTVERKLQTIRRIWHEEIATCA